MTTDRAAAEVPGGTPVDQRVMALGPERAAFDVWAKQNGFGNSQPATWCWQAWKGCRDDCVAHLERTAKHMRENAEALRKYSDMEQEARARELASCYVDEIARRWRVERQLTDLLQAP